MNITELLHTKKAKFLELKENFNFKNKNKIIGYIDLSNIILSSDLVEGLSKLKVNFVLNSKNLGEYDNIFYLDEKPKEMLGFDFVACDICNSDMKDYFSFGVVPIVSKNNVISPILSEFNVGKLEGNAFIFENDNKWEFFYALIRYIENHKFPYDNKALIKNVLEI